MIYINYYGFSTLMIDDKLHFLIRGRVFEKGYHSLTIEEERKIVQGNLNCNSKNPAKSSFTRMITSPDDGM